MKRIVYRCSLCGEIVFGNVVDMADLQMADFCDKVIRNQRFVGNPCLYQAPVFLTHNCADGSCGMAYFAGIVKED